jgi:hypothetical protein
MSTNATAVSVFSSFFSNKEEYLSFKARWKDLANNKALTVADAALRVLVLNQDALRSLPPTKNPARLANGALFSSGLYLGMSSVQWEASRARHALAKREKGETPVLTAFASRWVNHGISLEALASLEAKANPNNFTGAL